MTVMTKWIEGNFMRRDISIIFRKLIGKKVLQIVLKYPLKDFRFYVIFFRVSSFY